jgi:hypothetical protein
LLDFFAGKNDILADDINFIFLIFEFLSSESSLNTANDSIKNIVENTNKNTIATYFESTFRNRLQSLPDTMDKYFIKQKSVFEQKQSNTFSEYIHEGLNDINSFVEKINIATKLASDLLKEEIHNKYIENLYSTSTIDKNQEMRVFDVICRDFPSYARSFLKEKELYEIYQLEYAKKQDFKKILSTKIVAIINDKINTQVKNVFNKKKSEDSENSEKYAILEKKYFKSIDSLNQIILNEIPIVPLDVILINSELENRIQIIDREIRSIVNFNNNFESIVAFTKIDKYLSIVKNFLNVCESILEYNEDGNFLTKIENINFEKIRRYCNNLVDENKADEMQKYLAESGKMHKAIIYDALEQFIVHLDGKEITLIDWGCGQGLASMLVLDYIREKQLDIKIPQVILIDDDVIALNRTIAHIDALSFNEIEILALKSDNIETMNSPQTIQNDITLNLFANDKMPVDWIVLDKINLSQAYFICVSNKDSKFLDELYENISDCLDLKILSNRDGRIGKFQRFEKILRYDRID